MIERTWRAGDRIDLVLPLVVQRVKGIDKIEATRGQVALRYGPLIYSVEAADQNLDKVLQPEAPLRAEWRRELLNGVMIIKGTWADGTPLTAIPNYARNNRLEQAPENTGSSAGESRRRRGWPVTSTVWIKDQ